METTRIYMDEMIRGGEIVLSVRKHLNYAGEAHENMKRRLDDRIKCKEYIGKQLLSVQSEMDIVEKRIRKLYQVAESNLNQYYVTDKFICQQAKAIHR